MSGGDQCSLLCDRKTRPLATGLSDSRTTKARILPTLAIVGEQEIRAADRARWNSERRVELGFRADLRIQPAIYWRIDLSRSETNSLQRPRPGLTTATLFAVTITQPCFVSGVFSRLIAS